jgi:MFS family permease
VNTLLLGSFLQCVVLAGFLFGDSLTALYLLSVAFGLAQGGIVPSYAIIVRAYFPSRDAGWRIGTVFLFTIIGMALGGWMAGALYDLTGSYTVSFLNAIAFNFFNMAIAGTLLVRAKARAAALAAAQ